MRAALITALAALLTLGGAAGCAQACPGALFEGVLTAREGELVVVHEHGIVERVDWAGSGYAVRDAGDSLVVVEWFFFVKAREGDFVRLGGGESQTGVWTICGLFQVGHITVDKYVPG